MLLNASTNYPTKTFSVGEINAMVSDLVEGGFPAYLWVEGEVSNLSVAASGHRYFSLKDQRSLIACALFKMSASKINSTVLRALKNGDQVLVKAKLSVYQPRGNYQLIVSDIEAAGFGDLAKAFLLLKEKLDALGMTNPSHKKQIPAWPNKIAVVTSATGAAIRDVIATLKRRAPFIDIIVYPVLVQGDQSSQKISEALDQIELANQVDVILLVRGGGSLEDLQAFNSELLAHKIFNASIPIISGVGHETDFTIADFVADYRAETPTAAAEKASPDGPALLKEIEQTKLKALRKRMAEILFLKKDKLNQMISRLEYHHPERRLQVQRQYLDDLSANLFTKIKLVVLDRQKTNHYLMTQLSAYRPDHYFQQEKNRLVYLDTNLVKQTRHLIESKKTQLQALSKQLTLKGVALHEDKKSKIEGQLLRLHLLNPMQILDRGYSLVFDDQNNLIRSRSKLAYNDAIKIKFSDGEVDAKIKS